MKKIKDNCTNNIRRNVHVNTLTDMKHIIFENTALKKEIAYLIDKIRTAKRAIKGGDCIINAHQMITYEELDQITTNYEKEHGNN